MTATVYVALRQLAACLFAGGAVWLAYLEKDGWGWCIFAAVLIADFSVSEK